MAQKLKDQLKPTTSISNNKGKMVEWLNLYIYVASSEKTYFPIQHNFFCSSKTKDCDIKNWNKIKQLKDRQMGNPIGNNGKSKSKRIFDYMDKIVLPFLVCFFHGWGNAHRFLSLKSKR